MLLVVAGDVVPGDAVAGVEPVEHRQAVLVALSVVGLGPPQLADPTPVLVARVSRAVDLADGRGVAVGPHEAAVGTLLGGRRPVVGHRWKERRAESVT